MGFPMTFLGLFQNKSESLKFPLYIGDLVPGAGSRSPSFYKVLFHYSTLTPYMVSL